MFVFHLSELLLLEIYVMSCLQDVLRNITVTSQMLTKYLEILKAGSLYDEGNLSNLP